MLHAREILTELNGLMILPAERATPRFMMVFECSDMQIGKSNICGFGTVALWPCMIGTRWRSARKRNW